MAHFRRLRPKRQVKKHRLSSPLHIQQPDDCIRKIDFKPWISTISLTILGVLLTTCFTWLLYASVIMILTGLLCFALTIGIGLPIATASFIFLTPEIRPVLLQGLAVWYKTLVSQLQLRILQTTKQTDPQCSLHIQNILPPQTNQTQTQTQRPSLNKMEEPSLLHAARLPYRDAFAQSHDEAPSGSSTQSQAQVDTPESDPAATIATLAALNRQYLAAATSTPMPHPRSLEAPCFNGLNVSAFCKEYQRMCKRCDTPDHKACLVIEDYCTDDISNEVKFLAARNGNSLSTLLLTLRNKYASSDRDFVMTTELALERFVLVASQEPYHDLTQYCRHFTAIVQSIEDGGGKVDDTRKVKLLLQGLPNKDMEKVIRKIHINPLALHNHRFEKVLQAVEDMGSVNASIRILQTGESDQNVVDQRVKEWRNMSKVVLPLERIVPSVLPMPVMRQDTRLDFPTHGSRNPFVAPEVQSAPKAASTDDLIESFKKMKLSSAALFTAINSSALVNSLSTDQIVNICVAAQSDAPPAHSHNVPAPTYSYASAPSSYQNAPAAYGQNAPPRYGQGAPAQGASAPRAPGGYPQAQNSSTGTGRSPLVCHCCNLEGHTYRQCPELKKLIDAELIHFGPEGLLNFGSAQNPGNVLPRLPPSNRLLKIREILGVGADLSHQAPQWQQPAISSITLLHEDGDSSSDEECLWTEFEGPAAAAAIRSQDVRKQDGNGIQDKTSRVYKHPQKPTRVKADRYGEYVPQEDFLTAIPFPDPRVRKSGDLDMHDVAPENSDKPVPTKESREPRAQRLPDILGKSETDEASLRIVRKLLESPVTVTLSEALQVMPEVRKIFASPVKDAVAKRLLQTTEDGSRANAVSSSVQPVRVDRITLNHLTTNQIDRRFGNLKFYRSECPRVSAVVGAANIQVLLDTGAEVNVIREAFAHKAGLAIQSLPRSMRNERLQAANGTLEPFVGLVETEVTIGNITIRTPLLVTKHCTNDCILGEPFACRSTMVAQHTPSGRCLITISSEDGTRTVTVQAVAGIGKAMDNDLEDEDIHVGKEVMV
jgi:hypothetical protein